MTAPLNEAQRGIIMPAHLRRLYNKIVTSSRRRDAIRLHCLECCAWQRGEVLRCSARACILYPYRLGGYPGHEVRRKRSPGTS